MKIENTNHVVLKCKLKYTLTYYGDANTIAIRY